MLPADVVNLKQDKARAGATVSKLRQQLKSGKKMTDSGIADGRELKPAEKLKLKDQIQVIDIIVDPQANTKVCNPRM